MYICNRCLCHFTKEDLFNKHNIYCSNNETAAVLMSPKNTKLYFKNYYKKFSIPFVIYVDFECFTKPLQTCQPYPNDSYTYSYQKHEPSGFCLYLKGLDGINKLFNQIVYTKKTDNKDISKIFVEKITHKVYKEYYKKPKTMKITTQEQEEFNKATICHICEKEFLEDDSTARMLKVRDHCHFTDEYRGAAHNSCNIQCKKPLILPVIFIIFKVMILIFLLNNL